MSRHFVIYDTETSGANPTFDQILQAAAILCDGAFAEQDSLDIRAQILPYIVPSPKALEVTGVRPHRLNDQEAYTPFAFARRLHAVFQRWSPAIYLGYNTVKFDEEIVREAFFQNLLFPYVTNSRGSKRADLLIMMRALSAIQPEIFEIPLNAEGKQSFRLEHIAPANGFKDMDAHDALGDVRATAFMAKLCQERAPEAWEHLLQLADPKGCDEIIARGELYLTTHFGVSETHHCAVLGACPSNAKQVGVFDLSCDPTPYLDRSPEQLAEAMKTDFRILRTLKTNQQPVIFAPDSHLAPAVTGKTDADGNVQPVSAPAIRAQRLQMIQDHPNFKMKVAEALQIRANSFSDRTQDTRVKQPEELIYDGFPGRNDKSRQDAFLNTEDWVERWAIANAFEDQRLKRLARRVVLSECPQVIPGDQLAKIRAAMARERVLAEDPDDALPWLTLPKARQRLDEVDDPELRQEIARYLDALEDDARAAIAADQPAKQTA